MATAPAISFSPLKAFSRQWPRFSLESEVSLNQIPGMYVDDERGGMRCNGNRCAALAGDVGISTACAIYAVRPDVCKALFAWRWRLPNSFNLWSTCCWQCARRITLRSGRLPSIGEGVAANGGRFVSSSLSLRRIPTYARSAIWPSIAESVRLGVPWEPSRRTRSFLTISRDVIETAIRTKVFDFLALLKRNEQFLLVRRRWSTNIARGGGLNRGQEAFETLQVV